MQNAKDTFYAVLRDRVAEDAALTVVVRGVVRPAVLVDENEMVTSAELRDCFRIRWTGLRMDEAGLVASTCEIQYATAGSPGGGGLDRGRGMAALDSGLAAAVNTSPQNAVKRNFAGLAGGGAVGAMGSNIWWSDVVFGALTEVGGEMRRTATVEVWSYQEAGEA